SAWPHSGACLPVLWPTPLELLAPSSLAVSPVSWEASGSPRSSPLSAKTCAPSISASESSLSPVLLKKLLKADPLSCPREVSEPWDFRKISTASQRRNVNSSCLVSMQTLHGKSAQSSTPS